MIPPLCVEGSVSFADVEALEAALRRELPRFALAYKDESRLQRLIAALVRPFNRTYATHYTTVMFGKVYFPSRAWVSDCGAEAVYGILRHEAVHLRDMRRFPVLFHLSYLGLLPAGLTMRAIWEWRGYRETMRVHAELHGDIPDYVLRHIERCFTGPDYLYMCPFPKYIRRKLVAERARILGRA
ncbi:MAG: hypothetical protein R3F60_02015 [bacterium]